MLNIEDSTLCAGGLIFYDQEGVYLIKEKYNKDDKLCDPGGKYYYADCSIVNTISREFCEETYFTFEMSPWILSRLLECPSTECVYTCTNGRRDPTYLCILVNIAEYKSLVKTLSPDAPNARELFLKNRETAISRNPATEPKYYSSYDFVHLKFSETREQFYTFHYRLKQIFLNSTNWNISNNDDKSDATIPNIIRTRPTAERKNGAVERGSGTENIVPSRDVSGNGGRGVKTKETQVYDRENVTGRNSRDSNSG